MTPDQYISELQGAARDFDIIAEAAIRAVGIEFFKSKYNEAFNKGETAKGNSFEGAVFSVRGGQYKKDFRMWKKLYSYDRLNLSIADGNKTSFRKSMFFDGEGASLTMSDNATWKGEEYGSEVIKTMYQNGIDVLEYENKDEADKELFLKEFVSRIFMGDLPF